MRAWWSQLFVPHSDTHLRSSIACSLLCLEEPMKYNASGPDSLRIASSRSPISLTAWSQERRWYLPFTSFIGYFSRCECSVMPCSRTDAPLAQCAPRLSGESNTGSCRTHTPFCTTASIAQPTEQCVHTVRFTSILPALSSAASALPIMLNGSRVAKAPAPTATPERFRKARRSMVFASIPERLRDRRLWPEERCAGAPADVLVSNMVTPPRDSDFCGVVVAADVRGFLIALAAFLVVACGGLGCDRFDRLGGDRGCRCGAAGADCE